MALDVPHVESHPNRLPFRGLLTLVDVASDRAPSGSRGHRTLMRRDAAERALPSLLGMALNFASKFDKHDPKHKVGIITGAEIHDNEIYINGFLYAKDFPELAAELLASSPIEYGLSYEIVDAHVADLNATVWDIYKLTFTGAAVLRRDKAAYRSTWFSVGKAHPEALPPGCNSIQ